MTNKDRLALAAYIEMLDETVDLRNDSIGMEGGDPVRLLLADRDRLAAELARAQAQVRRAWDRAAALWDGYDALKDFLDDESEDARDRSYSHLADYFQERVIEARQTLSRYPRPREDQLNFAALAQPQNGTTMFRAGG